MVVVVEFDHIRGDKRYSMGTDLESALADYHHCGSPVCWRDVDAWREVTPEHAKGLFGERYDAALSCLEKPKGPRVYYLGSPQ